MGVGLVSVVSISTVESYTLPSPFSPFYTLDDTLPLNEALCAERANLIS